MQNVWIVKRQGRKKSRNKSEVLAQNDDANVSKNFFFFCEFFVKCLIKIMKCYYKVWSPFGCSSQEVSTIRWTTKMRKKNDGIKNNNNKNNKICTEQTNGFDIVHSSSIFLCFFFLSFCWSLPLLSICALCMHCYLKNRYVSVIAIEKSNNNIKWNKNKKKNRTKSAMTFYHSCGYMHTDLSNNN